MLQDFSTIQIVWVSLIFAWTGFVRSGLGFGGAALGLPLMLFIDHQPLFWLPLIGTHLLFFSALTLRTRLHNVDWPYLRRAALFIVPAAIVGILGLLNLPTNWLVVFIYSITLFYAVIWMFNLDLRSNHNWLDRVLLVLGGYVAGTSLSGAPLMVAVFMRNIPQHQLRNTMFVLWFILVSLKMTAFAVVGVKLNLPIAIMLLPIAAVGHYIGLKTHDVILQNDRLFKRFIGAALSLICILGFATI
jgi:uncharacterized membrane protein YfcA